MLGSPLVTVLHLKKIRLLLAIASLGAAAFLSGCVVFVAPPTAGQQDVIGKVRSQFTVCVSGANDDPPGGPNTGNEPDHPGCPDFGNSSASPSSNQDGQLLLGFRVPAGADPPATFHSSAGEALTMTRSPSYEAQLQSLVPPPAGQQWVGYISNVYHYDGGADETPAKQASFAVDFGLPPASGGQPFTGPFGIRPVVGVRRVNDTDPSSSNPSSRPVSCGDRVFGGDDFPSTVCIDSPDKATTATNINVPTRDLAVVGSRVRVDPGHTATVPFTAKLAGDAPGQPFSLAAATNLHGAVASASRGLFTPGANSKTSLAADVRVPHRAAAGVYLVALRARLANGQERLGFAALRVRDKIDPVLRRLGVHPSTFAPFPDTSSIARRRGARVSYRLSEPATVTFRVQRRVRGRYRTLKGSFRHKSKRGVNRFRFTGYIRHRRLRPGRYRLVGVPVDRAKNKGRAVRARFRIVR